MQTSSIFCIGEDDASEFLQEDFDLDFTDENRSSREMSTATAQLSATKNHNSGFGKFVFKPTAFNAAPATSAVPSTPNNAQQVADWNLCSSSAGLVRKTFKPITAKDPASNFSNGFQKFDPKVHLCSSDEREKSSASPRFVPTANGDNPSNPRQQYLSSLTILQGSKLCDGKHGIQSAPASSSDNAPDIRPSSNPGPRCSVIEKGRHSAVISNFKRPAEDMNDKNAVDSSSIGVFRKFPCSQFLSPKRTRSSPALLSEGSEKGSLPKSSGDAVREEQPFSDRISNKSLSSPTPSSIGVVSKSVFVPVSNSGLDERPAVKNASPQFSSAMPKTAVSGLAIGQNVHPGLKSNSPPFSTGMSSSPLSTISDFSLEEDTMQLIPPSAQTPMSEQPLLHRTNVPPKNSVTSSRIDSLPAHHRLRQIPDVRPSASPSNQFQKRSPSSVMSMGSPTVISGQFRRQGNTPLPNSNVRLLRPQNCSSSPRPSRPMAVHCRYPFPSTMNTPRQQWASPNPRAPFSGRFTSNQLRTPRTPLSGSILSPIKHPVLTPRVAQLCRTPTGPLTSGPASSSRKFPGPAGILPKLSPGQKLSSIKLSPPSDEEQDKKEKEPAECSQSSQPGIDDFSQGAWATMKKELDFDHGDQQSILAQHSIASVLRKASMRQLHRNKVPHICVMVKTIVLQANDAVVTFRDPTGEMQGTIHKRLVEEYQGDLKPGCVLLLRQVGVLSPSLRNHYLNVTHRNVVQIFPPEPIPSQRSPVMQTPKRPRPKSIRVNCDKGHSKDETSISSDKTNVSSDRASVSSDKTGSPQGNCSSALPLSTLIIDSPVESTSSWGRITPAKCKQGAMRTDVVTPTQKDHPVTHTANLRGCPASDSSSMGKSSAEKSGPSGASDGRHASEMVTGGNKNKRVCVEGILQGPSQKENVCPDSLNISEGREQRLITNSSSTGGENIADLIEGFEDELFADF